MKQIFAIFAILFLLAACTPASTQTVEPAPVTETLFAPDTSTLPPSTATFTAIPTLTSTSTSTATLTPLPTVESLEASVTADLLSCRYGPGAEYLYLYGLRKEANIELIGRTDGNNWVMVQGKSKCWVNAKFLDVKGDAKALKILYPEGYKLPVSPYYPPTDWVGAQRDGDKVEVEWNEVPVSANDYEDADMFVYIIEVWRCENGQIIFDPLATNDLGITFTDESGCTVPSHGRVYVQEKHGFAGPVEIPWPGH